MKKIIILIAIELLTQRVSKAQGMLSYISNLDLPSTSSEAIGSDSWLAMDFFTGNNTDGYSLDSIQLAMTSASGSPSGLAVALYTQTGVSAGFPGSNIGALNGSANPVMTGVYTYTSSANLILLPNTDYYIVLTAGTTITTGAYEWGITSENSYNSNGGWGVIGGVSTDFLHSSNGSSWNSISFAFPQFAITATPIPEPIPLSLFLFGSCIFIYARRIFQR
jgi:hypothetical protein